MFEIEQQNKTVDLTNHVQPIPESIPEETENRSVEEKDTSVPNSESVAEPKKETACCENGVSSEVSHTGQESEHSSGNTNGRRKDKNKRTINGLVKSVASPERVNKDSKDLTETLPEAKKIKVENENSLQDKEVEDLLIDSTLVKMPNQPPQTQGTATAMETVSASSSEDIKQELANESASSESAQCSDSAKFNRPVENSPRRDENDKTHEHSTKEKDSKSEKKHSEQHHRKNKKRKEKKKHRHASGNDSTGSDAPGSPMYNQSPASFSSPRRPRMSFDMDLGKT